MEYLDSFLQQLRVLRTGDEVWYVDRKAEMIRRTEQVEWNVLELEYICDGPACDKVLVIRSPGSSEDWEEFTSTWTWVDRPGIPGEHFCGDDCHFAWAAAMAQT